MVGEISHIVYAARLLSYLREDVSHASYWNGVIFPSIRRIAIQPRHPIHVQGVTLSTLRGSNDFLTGVRVHAWIDDMHTRFDAHQLATERIPDHILVPYARTLIEDELLYDAFADWDVVRKALRTIHHDELYYVHERASVRRWHDVLQTYFTSKPNDESRMAFSRAIGLSQATAHEVHALMLTLKDNSAVMQALESFVRDIEHAIV
ncbi:MAG: hypothetical protein K8Q97_03325 [Candidatus Andersenbacteria bacterium]|nr:hypothetical protein [Candidatus Andersenbacteria bacterium]